MEEKHELLFCSWVQSRSGKSNIHFFCFLCHICKTTVCWYPEILISVVFCKVSQPSRYNRKSYDGKFVTAKCSCINYGATLRSRNLAAMVTWRHMSLYCRWGQSYFFFKSGTSLAQTPGVGSLLFLSHFLEISATRTPSRRSSVAFCESL